MSELNKEEIVIILEALNFLLKNQQDALAASSKIVPVAEKVKSLLKEDK